MSRVVRGSIPASALVLLASETLLLFSCYLLAAYWTPTTASIDLELYLLYDGGLLQIAFVVAVLQLGLYFQLLYETLLPRSIILLIQQLFIVIGIGFLAQSIAVYLNWSLELPRLTMVYGSLLTLLTLPLWRMAFSALASKTASVKRLLFMGTSEVTPEIVSLLTEHPELGMTVAGFVDMDSLENMSGTEAFQYLDDIIRSHRPDRIITALDGNTRVPTRLLLELQLSGIQVDETAVLYETITGRIPGRALQPDEFIFSSTFDSRISNPALLSTVVMGIVATLATLPLFILVAVLVKASSRGAVFSKHKRIGLGGIAFDLYRFRTTAGGEAIESNAPLTPVGRWIRRLGLEGLPQLFNIVRGELCIIGPHAERPEFATVLEAHCPFYPQRFSVRPGLTGWAQVNSRNAKTLPDAVALVEFDLYYIKNVSYTLDAYILLHSFPAG